MRSSTCKPASMALLSASMKIQGFVTLIALTVLMAGCGSNEAPPDMSKYDLGPDVEFSTIYHVNTELRLASCRLPDKLPPPPENTYVLIYRSNGRQMRAVFVGSVRTITQDHMTVYFTKREGNRDAPRSGDLIEIRNRPLTSDELKAALRGN